MKEIFKLVIVSILLESALASFFYDLLSHAELDGKTGVTKVKGPIDGSTAYDLADNTGQLSSTPSSYPYIMNTLMYGDDFTFSFQFKLKTEPKPGQFGKYTFLSFAKKSDEDAAMNTYFAISLKYIRKTAPEGTPIEDTIEQNIEIEQKPKSKGIAISSVSIKGNPIKTNQWARLTVRIRNRQYVTANYNCKVSNTTTLGEKMGVQGLTFYPYSGNLVIGQKIEADDDGNINIVKNTRFVGEIYDFQLVVGTKAFDYYLKPCGKIIKLKPIPAEPKLSDYDDTRFNEIYEMSKDVPPIKRISCTIEYKDSSEQNKSTSILIGETFKLGCEKWTCLPNDTPSEYMCVDVCDAAMPDTGNKIRRAKENWIFPDIDPCKRFTCNVIRRDKSVTNETLNCAGSTCNDKFGKTSKANKGECCPRCKANTCTNGKIYTDDKTLTCDLKCGDPYDKDCSKSKAEGCFCPSGQAFDDLSNKCVPMGNCPCKGVGGRVYQPNQIVRRSRCVLCICGNGQFQCIRTCSY